MMFRKCQHLRTRCIHGDEAWDRMKTFMRWWKEPVVRRQACRDCGAALDRGPICTVTGRCVHEGPWPIEKSFEEVWDEAAEATAEWMANNPGPSGIPHDPPRNPYRVD